MQAVKVVITAPWGERLGGAENLLWTFLRRVDRKRIEPHVVFLAAGSFADEVRALGIDTTVLPIGRLRNAGTTVSAVRRLAALLRRVQPGVVLDWTTKSHVVGGSAALLAGRRRSVWWQHGFPGSGLLDRVAAAVPARAIICSSAAVAAAQRGRTIVVHPFVDETPPARTVARAELGIPADRFVLGVVGRLQPWKRQHLVLEAVHDAVAAGVDAHALVVGGDAHGLSPEYPRRLRALEESLGLGGRVTFTGHVADPREYLPAVDVLVNASTDEPFGMVLLEGMASGTPVVAFASGGPLEIVEDEESGVLLAGEPRRALAAATVRLANEPGLRTRLAAGGRARYAERFAAERLVRQLEDELLLIAAEADR